MIIVTDKFGAEEKRIDATFVFRKVGSRVLRECENCKSYFLVVASGAGRQRKGGRTRATMCRCALCRPTLSLRYTKPELIEIIEKLRRKTNETP